LGKGEKKGSGGGTVLKFSRFIITKVLIYTQGGVKDKDKRPGLIKTKGSKIEKVVWVKRSRKGKRRGTTKAKMENFSKKEGGFQNTGKGEEKKTGTFISSKQKTGLCKRSAPTRN